MNTLPELITPQQAKSYFHCNDKTIYNLCKRRDFPSFRIGKRYLINKDDFIEWIKRKVRRIKIYSKHTINTQI